MYNYKLVLLIIRPLGAQKLESKGDENPLFGSTPLELWSVTIALELRAKALFTPVWSHILSVRYRESKVVWNAFRLLLSLCAASQIGCCVWRDDLYYTKDTKGVVIKVTLVCISYRHYRVLLFVPHSASTESQVCRSISYTRGLKLSLYYKRGQSLKWWPLRHLRENAWLATASTS